MAKGEKGGAGEDEDEEVWRSAMGVPEGVLVLMVEVKGGLLWCGGN
jgi:hypothetical protein